MPLQIAFGISALGGIAKATIDLDLDTSAKLALNLQASADASIQTGAGGQASGCVDLQAGFAVNAGADASFFSIFSVGDSFTLFSKEFELFNVGSFVMRGVGCGR